MSISLEPDKGLRLKLDRFSPIRTWHGGGNFWNHEFQLTVRQGALADFLPRAIEDDDSVLYELRDGGEELASASVAVGNLKQVPDKAQNALAAAVAEFKAKADDPHCDRTKRQMIESFRLPDPQKDRELYRLVGKGSKQRLIVLWGVEREEGSALAPGAAVDLMHTPRGESAEAAPAPARKSAVGPVLVVLLLLALGGGGWWYYQQEQQKKREAEAAALAASSAEEQARIEAFNAGAQSTGDAGGAAAVGKGGDPGGKAMAGKGAGDAKGQAGKGSKSVAGDAASSGGDAASESKTPPPGVVLRDEKGTIKGVVDKDGKIIETDTGTVVDDDGKVVSGKPGTVVRDDKGKVTGVVAKDGKVTPAAAGKTVGKDDADAIAKAAPGTVVRDTKGTVTGVVGKDGKVVTATPGTKVDKDGKITADKAGTVVRDSQGKVTGVVGKDGKVVATTPGQVWRRNHNGTYSRTGTTTGTGTRTGDGKTTGTTASTSKGKGAGDGKATGTTASTGKGKGTGDGKSTGTTASTGKGTGTGTRSGTTTGTRTGTGTTTGTGSGTTTGTGTTASTAAGSGGADDKDSVATRMTTNGPPPAGVSSMTIVSTSLSAVLGDGTVEVLLNVVARDASGAVVQAPPIGEWRVDGEVATQADGSGASGPVLPARLSAGQHRISTIGRGGDGKPFQTDADVVIAPKR